MATRHPRPAVSRDVTNHSASSAAIHKPPHTVGLIKAECKWLQSRFGRICQKWPNLSCTAVDVTCMAAARLCASFQPEIPQKHLAVFQLTCVHLEMVTPTALHCSHIMNYPKLNSFCRIHSQWELHENKQRGSWINQTLVNIGFDCNNVSAWLYSVTDKAIPLEKKGFSR